MGWGSTEQSKWERLAEMVDLGAAANVLPAGVCSHVKLSATRRSEAGIGFRGAGGRRIRNHFKVRMTDGHVAGSTRQVADVKRPLTSVARMVAAGNRLHLDSKDPRIVRRVKSFLCGKLETCSSSISGSEKTQPAGSRVFTGRPASRSLRNR